MQKSATVEELIAQLEKKGAGVLGKLRGRGGFLQARMLTWSGIWPS
jgi:hypothetical protein